VTDSREDARKALLAFAKAWTYPILGNEDVPVTKRLFEEARALSKDVAASATDPPEFAGWLEVVRDESRDDSNEWEDTLHAVADYFGSRPTIDGGKFYGGMSGGRS
jgi:hypothetical protein